MNNTSMSEHSPHQPYRCHLDWGESGAVRAAEREDAVVLVDTLSFSTSVITAVHLGALVYPCSEGDDVIAVARRIGGEAAVPRVDVPDKGRFSLSPLTYLEVAEGTRIVLPSLNGGTCSHAAGRTAFQFIGAFVNARAVGAAVSRLLKTTELSVTVVACGELQKHSSKEPFPRFASEDYLASGAIISYFECKKSPEARLCESSFLHNRGNLASLLRDCESGRELYRRGYGKDVEFAAQLDIYETVPIRRGEFFEQQR